MWRRSGFWTTSLRGLDLDALELPAGGARPGAATPGAGGTQPGAAAPGAGVPAVVERTLPDRARAGRIVQSAGAVVHVELDPALAERGVILCPLETAFAEHAELVAPWYSKRLTHRPAQAGGGERRVVDGGAFLYVPAGRGRGGAVRDRVRDRAARRRAVRAHARGGRARRASSACTSTTWRRTSTGPGAACGRVRAVSAGRRALPPGAGPGLGLAARCSTCRRASWASAATRTATGCRRCWAVIWCASTWSWR